LAVLVVALGALAVAAAPALAAGTPAYTAAGSFGSPGSGAGQLSLPVGMAVDQTTGDVYVADAGNARVDKFDSQGHFLLAFGVGVLDSANRLEVCTTICQAGNSSGIPPTSSAVQTFALADGVAVDNDPASPSFGDVYVSDFYNRLTLQKFSPSGAFLGTLVQGRDFNGPTGVATDQTGDVWLADGAAVEEWTGAGAFVGRWYAASTSNPFTFGISVDSADEVFFAPLGPTQKFASDGSPLGELDPAHERASALAVDPASNLLYDAQGGTVEVYDAGAAPPASPLASFGSFGLADGIAVDPAAGRVYVSDLFAGQVDAFTQSALPDVAAGQPSAATPTSATLNGTVDPVGSALSDCHFDYGASTAYGQSAPCASPLPAGASPAPVSAQLSGLQPDTTYHFRLVAADASGAANGADQTFTTTGPPTARGATVTGVADSTATLVARVNAHGFDTQVHFDYGTSSGYGQSAPAPDQDIGAGTADQDVSAALGALAPGTTYHYRVVASSAQGTMDGADHAFTTADPCPNAQLRTGYSAALPDCRAYEQVSPVDKGSVGVADVFTNAMFGFLAAPDGSRMAWTTSTGLPGQPADDVFYLSSRTAAGWSTAGEVPPQSSTGASKLCELAIGPEAYSSDLSAYVLRDGGGQDTPQTGCSHDDPNLVAGEPQGVQNLFVRDPGGSYGLASPAPVAGPPGDAAFYRAAADLSHVVFASGAQLTADAPQADPGASAPTYNLYDWSAGGVHLVNVLPDGTPALCNVDTVTASCYVTLIPGERHAVSADGSKIFFYIGGNLYVREGDARTVQVDASQAGGSGGGGIFQIASTDGAVVYFTGAPGLTSDSVPRSGTDLYRYDTNTGALADLTPVAGAGADAGTQTGGVLGASDDGSYVYFVANGVVAPGAAPGDCTQAGEQATGSCSLYVWHDGSTRFVARVSGADSPDWGDQVIFPLPRVSPDGRYLAFDSRRDLTGQAPGGSQQIYLYDYATGHLSCASCSPTGAPPTASVTLSTGTMLASDATGETTSGTGDAGAWLQRNLTVTASGAARVFFQTAERLLPAATNGKQNVYEYETGGAGGCREQAGCLSLISSGSGSSDAVFLDASATGDDVFFGTAQRLAASDIDGAVDVYDARVDGGLPAAAAPTLCSGEDCKGPASAPPPAPIAATVGFAGPGNATSTATPTGSATVLTRAVHGASFVVKVKAPSAGRISITGTGIGTVRRLVARAGTYGFGVSLTPAARRTLARRHALVLALRVGFAPPGAGAEAASVRLTVMPALRHRPRHARRAGIRKQGGAR
jgi:hypothetical protein